MTNSRINSIKNSRFIQPIRVNNNFFREKTRKNGKSWPLSRTSELLTVTNFDIFLFRIVAGKRTNDVKNLLQTKVHEVYENNTHDFFIIKGQSGDEKYDQIVNANCKIVYFTQYMKQVYDRFSNA